MSVATLAAVPATPATEEDSVTRAAVTAVRSAVRGNGTWITYVSHHGVTTETVKVHAATLAGLAFPKAEPVQRKDGKRTQYGNAVQAAGNGMRYALASLAGTDTEDDTEEKAPASKPLLTRAGEGATLDQIITAWHAANPAA